MKFSVDPQHRGWFEIVRCLGPFYIQVDFSKTYITELYGVWNVLEKGAGGILQSADSGFTGETRWKYT